MSETQTPPNAPSSETQKGEDPQLSRYKISQIKSAASALQREGRKILKKYEAKIGDKGAQSIRASVGSVDTLVHQEDWVKVEKEAENLDELLQTHAGFARKSAFRETLDNILIAVGIALLLRACTFEPFNIPSISMMPTLRIGDYIYVNKFVHGVQVPFTNTIVGKGWAKDIGRGEVIVFRYPLDHSIDYIKRVIGIPGDVLRFEGDRIWIQRGGEGEFEEIERHLLDIPCTDELDAEKPLPRCKVYEEHLDGERYQVRYFDNPPEKVSPITRIIKVPEDKYLVCGDNRHQSQDSLRWEITADVADARNILSLRDLRDALQKPELEASSKLNFDLLADPKHSQLSFRSPKSSAKLEHELQIWRSPFWGSAAQYAGLRQALAKSSELEPTRIDAFLAKDSKLPPGFDQGARDRALTAGRSWDGLLFATHPNGYEAVVHWAPKDLVLHYRCGRGLCASPEAFAMTLAQLVDSAAERSQSSSERILVDPRSDEDISFQRRRSWMRSQNNDRFWSGVYVDSQSARAKDSSKGGKIEVMVFSRGHEGLALLEQAALASVNASVAAAKSMPRRKGSLRWSQANDGFAAFWTIPSPGKSPVGLWLRCDQTLCKNEAQFKQLFADMEPKVVEAALEKRRWSSVLVDRKDLVLRSDSTGTEVEYPWDRVRSVGTQSGIAQSLTLDLRWDEDMPLDQRLALWRKEHGGGKEVPRLGAGAFVAKDEQNYWVGVAQNSSQSAVLLRCGTGLCDNEEQAIAVGNRVLERSKNADEFIAKGAHIPQPFVSRGLIKGRADYILWPFHRMRSGIDLEPRVESSSKKAADSK